MGHLVFSDLNLPVDALCIKRAGGTMVWGSPLVIGSLWSDFLSLGGFISRVNRASRPELMDTL